VAVFANASEPRRSASRGRTRRVVGSVRDEDRFQRRLDERRRVRDPAGRSRRGCGRPHGEGPLPEGLDTAPLATSRTAMPVEPIVVSDPVGEAPEDPDVPPPDE
jgi:hypothetical protein